MNWKEFFRPSILKIVLTIVLFIIGIVSLNLETEFVVMCEPGGTCPPPPPIHYVVNVVGDVLGFPASLEPIILLHDKGIIPNEIYYNRINRMLLAIPLGLIPNLIYLYVLTCLIIFIYRLIRKKSKK